MNADNVSDCSNHLVCDGDTLRGVSRYFYRRRRRVKSAEEAVFGGDGEVLRISFHNLSGFAYHLSTDTSSTDILSIDTSSTAYLVELILST